MREQRAPDGRREPEDAHLVRRSQQGEVDAFEAIFRRYQGRIYTFLLHMVGSSEEAEDLTQTTFVRAWEAIGALRSPQVLGAWLHRIAANAARDYLKSARRQVEAPMPEPDAPALASASGATYDPADRALDAEARERVSRALAALSPPHRSVLVMHHVEGMGVEEIARSLGVRPGTVMSRLARAREALRDALAEYLDQDQAEP